MEPDSLTLIPTIDPLSVEQTDSLIAADYPFLDRLLDTEVLGLNLRQPIIICGKILLIILVTWLAITIINFLFHRSRKHGRLLLDETGNRYLQRIIKFILYVICISSILFLIPGMNKLGAGLLTSAGILAAAIGLASQEALSNFIGGLFIIISKPFRVGDFIQMDGTVIGTVKEITLRHTVVLNTENRTIYVPNSKINSNTIINSSSFDPATCAFVEVGVAYTEDLDHCMDLMRDEVMKHPLLIDRRSDADREAGVPQVKMKVVALGDSSITLRAWAWAASSAQALEMKFDLLKSIKERFDREGIEIPYPYYNQIVRPQS